MAINFILAFTVIFLERKNASSTWAWIMVLFFIPILGFMLYLIYVRNLSNRYNFTWHKKRKHGVEQEVQAQLKVIENDECTYKQEVLREHQDLYYMHLKHKDAIYSQDNDVKIFIDGNKKFHSLIANLEAAEDNIHLLYYIICGDQLSTAIANVL